jgi:hypothetical protein
MDKPADQAQSRPRDLWDKANLAVDIAHKIIILIIGSAVAAVFYWFQQQQLDSRYFSDLMSQRESSDSQLRTQMFKTLFDAYFANKLQAKDLPGDQASSKRSASGIAPTPAVMSAQLATLKQETMFTDLLSRNFDSIDVRPLFEDLDARLAASLESAGKSKALRGSRPEIFSLREQLRRVAVGTSSRQTTALASTAGATATTHRVKQCRGEEIEVEPAFTLTFSDFLIVDRLSDGSVAMRVVPAEASGSKAETESLRLRVTFYDMPSLENVVLPSGKRVAFTLSRYLSDEMCREFEKELDEVTGSDCKNPEFKDKVCDRAWIRAIVLPKQFIGVRDRPYFNDLVSGKFRQ